MLHEFLDENRAGLIERCQAKVACRTWPQPTRSEMEHGIPLFLGQLIETLRLEQDPGGSAGFDGRDLGSEIAATATKHGHELLEHGFTVNQVVHDYGDLCQAITELAAERRAPVSTEEFQTLNRCLDNAIAEAVTEFGRRRDHRISETGNLEMNERLGSLAHEMRNFLNTAMLAFAAIKTGGVGLQGATSAVVDRSHAGLRDLVDRALADTRLLGGLPAQLEDVPVDQLVAEVQVAAGLQARTRQCGFTVMPVPPDLAIRVDRQMLFSAVSNLLQNAFKFTRPHSHVHLRAHGVGDRVLIEVEDQCGGLPPGAAANMFRAFEQHAADRSGLGLGLSIARRAVEASGGSLRVRDMPAVGCVFTIDLPRQPPRPDPRGERVRAQVHSG